MKQKCEIQNIINIIVPPLRKWVPKKLLQSSRCERAKRVRLTSERSEWVSTSPSFIFLLNSDQKFTDLKQLLMSSTQRKICDSKWKGFKHTNPIFRKANSNLCINRYLIYQTCREHYETIQIIKWSDWTTFYSPINSKTSWIKQKTAE